MSDGKKTTAISFFQDAFTASRSDAVAQQHDRPSGVKADRQGPISGPIRQAKSEITAVTEERDQLKKLYDSGLQPVQEIDPGLIDPSPYPDRLPDDDALAFEAFKRSIMEEGQKVPIQIRANPNAAGRYQVVYGHRRAEATRQLGIKVRAVEIVIEDDDLLIAQGVENGSRQDLSWIERALFASRMKNAGIKSRVVYAALAIEDAELARMRSVCSAIPEDIILAIGRAPKVGRPRWQELAKSINDNPHAVSSIQSVVAGGKFASQTSDKKFQVVLDAVKPDRVGKDGPQVIADAGGIRLGSCTISKKELRIAGDGQLGAEFLRFIGLRLPDLVDEFTNRNSIQKP